GDATADVEGETPGDDDNFAPVVDLNVDIEAAGTGDEEDELAEEAVAGARDDANLDVPLDWETVGDDVGLDEGLLDFAAEGGDSDLVDAADVGSTMADLQLDETITELVPGYVARIAHSQESRDKIVKTLESGHSYVEREEMVVAMIDISGYSAITADLASLGKASSEIITSTVNNFFKKVIDAIYGCNGDVIK
ncbi:hypothetical protein HDV05_001519, partial [Chytridiales sp. JEL 0842]